MALEGTIKDFGLADILQLIGIQRKTGVLSLSNGNETVVVKFVDGQVVGADTGDRNFEDLLGSVLVRTGRVTHTQLQEALRVQKRTLQRLGYILIKQHFISEDDLVEALRIQVTQIVYRLFRWRSGKYQFNPMDHIEYDTAHFEPIGAETILMEGARMIDEWPIIERRVKSPAMVLRKTRAGSKLDIPVASTFDGTIDLDFQEDAEPGRGVGEESRITPEERNVLRMVDGSSSVQDIVDASPLGEFDVHRVLYELLTKQLVEEVEISVVAGVAPAGETRSRWLSGGAQAVVWALAILGAATLASNPFTPWRLASHAAETEILRAYVSRNRIERLDRAIDLYYLDRGAIPGRLEDLTPGGYVSPVNLRDPWGRPYSFRRDATGYEIAGEAAGGVPREELIVRHRFTPSQRMVLEGGVLDRGPSGP